MGTSALRGEVPSASFEILEPSAELRGRGITQPVTVGSDGALYGVAVSGGANDLGVVFRITPGGEYRTIAFFSGFAPRGLPGSTPRASLTPASDGRLYGTSGETVFYVTPGENATVTHVARFSDVKTVGSGLGSLAPLVMGSDHRLYGTTQSGGSSSYGTVFRVTPGPNPIVEHVSDIWTDQMSGHSPTVALEPGPDGRLYGTTHGSANHYGTVFVVTPGDTATVQQIGRFTNTGGSLLPGSRPVAKLLHAPDGKLYGTTSLGGSASLGTVFVVTPGETPAVSTLASFTGAGGSLPGSTPTAALKLGADGRLYGTTEAGGSNNAGTVFRITLGEQPIFESVASFVGGTAAAGIPGSVPKAALVDSGDGKLYGVTSDITTIFSVTPGDTASVEHVALLNNGARAQSELVSGGPGKFYGVASAGNGSVYIFEPGAATPVRTLAALSYPETQFPSGALARGADGAFYGVTRQPKATLFRITTAGVYQELESIPGGATVNLPLTLANDGRLYGTLKSSSRSDEIIVIDTESSPRIRTVTTFSNSLGTNGFPGVIPGLEPRASLVEGPDGRLYGSTSSNVSSGTVFVVTPGANPVAAHIGALPGWSVYQPLTLAPDGRLYGTSLFGGSGQSGTLFRVIPGATPTVQTFASFTGTDGSLPGRKPLGTLQVGADGFLYGATAEGGSADVGTLFRILIGAQPTVTSIASFTGSEGALPGRYPWAAPVLASDGNLYGTASGKTDLNDFGTVYRLSPGIVPTVTNVVTFTGMGGEFPGDEPHAPLVVGGDGRLYGWTIDGGAQNQGVLFSIQPGETPAYNIVCEFGIGATGMEPQGELTRVPNGGIYGMTRSSIVRVKFDTAPVLLGAAATGVTTSDATLTATVFPSESATDLTFEYGTSVQYGSAATLQGVGAGNADVRASTTVSGLAPHTSYHYRVVTGNQYGTTTGPDLVFTTSNTLPIAVADVLISNGSAVTADLCSNDSDADADSLTIESVTQPAFGTVTWEGSQLTYTPTTTFFGRDRFEYTISDGFGGIASAEVQVYATEVLARIILSRGDTLPGIPGMIRSLTPLWSSSSPDAKPVVLATLSNGKKLTSQALLSGEPPEVLLSSDSEAPSLSGVQFEGFRTVVGPSFIASFRSGTGDTSAKTDTSVWTGFPDSLALVAREGDPAPGITGARFKAFTALDHGSAAVFTATVAGPGINTSSDLGLWAETAAGLHLVCRERAQIEVAGEMKQVKTFALHLASSNRGSFVSSCSTAGLIAYRVSFTDKTQAILTFDSTRPEEGSSIIAVSGQAVEEGNVYETFGLPTCTPEGRVAFRTRIRQGGSDSRKSQEMISMDGRLIPSTVTGGTERAVPVSDPLMTSDAVTFLAKLSEGKSRPISGVAVATDAELHIIARVGGVAPGTADARFSRFVSLGMPDDAFRGPIFIAALALQQGAVTAANQMGLWGVDSNGTLILVLRGGQILNIGGEERQVKRFSFVPVAASPYNADGNSLCLVRFTDGTESILHLRVP